MEEGMPIIKLGWNLETVENLIFHVQKVDENIKGEQPSVVYRSLSRLEEVLANLKDALIDTELAVAVEKEYK